LAALTLGALGVVLGGIGTSPLDTLQACLVGAKPEDLRADVLGVRSLIVLALMLVVTVKSLRFVMRADDRGEGVILALLAPEKLRGGRPERVTIIAGLACVTGTAAPATPSASRR
jgi:KUP system potassium uptake protein